MEESPTPAAATLNETQQALLNLLERTAALVRSGYITGIAIAASGPVTKYPYDAIFSYISPEEAGQAYVGVGLLRKELEHAMEQASLMRSIETGLPDPPG